MSQWQRIKCLDSSGKPYWHLIRNLTTGMWFDVRILRTGQAENSEPNKPPAIEAA